MALQNNDKFVDDSGDILTTFPEQLPWPGQHKKVPPLQYWPLWEHPALSSSFGLASAIAKAESARSSER